MSLTPTLKDSLLRRCVQALRDVTISLLVIALLGIPANAEAPVDDAAWTVAPELLKHLSKAVTLDSVSIQPPVGYTQTRHPKADVYEVGGVKTHVWLKQDSDGLHAVLTLVIFPPLTKEAWAPEKFMRGFSKRMASEWQRPEMSKITKGRLGDAAAAQSRYSGTTKDGEHITGILLAFNDSAGTVMVNGMTTSDEVNTELKILLSSAITCRRVKKDR